MSELAESLTNSFVLGLGDSHLFDTRYMGWCPGYFANVVELDNKQKIAMSMDGVGSKLTLADQYNKYKVIGNDCIAMNVNDVICVGAEPISFMNYINMSFSDGKVIKEIAEGYREAAKKIKLNIIGGETSYYKQDGHRSLDVCGAVVGKLKFKTPIMGQDLKPGDKIFALHSNGIHANGLSKAVEALSKKPDPSAAPIPKMDYIAELLKPTALYSPVINRLFDAGIKPSGLVNVTGGGIKNLLRLKSKGCGFKIHTFPPIANIFKAIRERGKIGIQDMFYHFNMGAGFYVMVSDTYAPEVTKILDKSPHGYTLVGEVITSEQKTIKWDITSKDLI